MATFDQLGVPQWLCSTLATNSAFGFTKPLPVQAAVIPFAMRAFASWLLHCDVGLASPTGSGKTLCYCLPLLNAIVEQRQRFVGGYPDRHIRGVIVVPTSVLAEQINDLLLILAKPADLVVGTLFRATDDGSSLTRWMNISTSNSGNSKSSGEVSRRRKRFGAVDVIVATPQKACSWIESLADEDEELIQQDDEQHEQEEEEAERERAARGKNNNNKSKKNIDDDDDDDANADGSKVSKTKTRAPHSAAAASPSNRGGGTVADVLGRCQVVVLDEADDLLSTSLFTSMAGRIVETIQAAVAQVGETVLHKMLCSATLTARISKVSDVKLQNARYFALDAGGDDLSARIAAESGGGGVTAKRGADIVRPLFPLPSSLEEHLVIVRDDSKRHVTLLTTVRHALADLQQKSAANNKNNSGAAVGVQSDGAATSSEAETAAAVPKQNHSAWRTNNGGNSVIVFCQTAEIARVMGHFLATAGVNALELTTLTSEAERRQAALAVAASSSSGEQRVIVVSDALMRGIDMPGVGAVVMYNPPTTLQQYIHRVGRTARAGAPGSSYVLLSKVGESGTEADGQVAHFKSFDSMLLRSAGRKVSNRVKLRELPDEEVAKADEMLARTQQRLNSLGFMVSAAAAASAAVGTSNSDNNNNRKSGGQRRGRK